MKHKSLFISLTAILTALVFTGIFIGIWFLGDTYPDFDREAKKEFKIPGLDDGAIPQGMSSCEANYTVTEIKQQTEKDENGNPKKDDQGNDIIKDVEVTTTKKQPYFFISANMSDGSPSRIYVVGENTGYVGYVTLKDEDGNPFTKPIGGIAINNYTNETGTAYSNNKTYAKYYSLWVTSENYVYVAKCTDDYAAKYKSIAQEIVEKAAKIKLNVQYEVDESGNKILDDAGNPIEKEYDFSIKFTKSFNANCRVSFCYYFDSPNNGNYASAVSYDKLYIGEVYNDDKSATDSSCKITTPSGYKNSTFMYEYVVDKDSAYGLALIDTKSDSDPVKQENYVPKVERIFSIPENIKGVAWSGRDSSGSNNGILVLSQSYGLENSKLLCFDYSKVMSSSNSATYAKLTGANFEYQGIQRTSGKTYTSNPSVNYVDKGDSKMFIKELSLPSMANSMCNFTESSLSNSKAGITKFYVLFESASKKYAMFARERLSHVYSFRFLRLSE